MNHKNLRQNNQVVKLFLAKKNGKSVQNKNTKTKTWYIKPSMGYYELVSDVKKMASCEDLHFLDQTLVCTYTYVLFFLERDRDPDKDHETWQLTKSPISTSMTAEINYLCTFLNSRCKTAEIKGFSIYLLLICLLFGPYHLPPLLTYN